MHRPKAPIARILLLLTLINLCAYLLAGCPSERQMASYTKHGLARDTIYSVDYRGNGVIILWMTHADEGYCFSDKDKVDQAEDLLRHHNGEVLIDYESQVTSMGETPSQYDPQYLCYRTEVTGTVYLGRSITPVSSRVVSSSNKGE